MKRNFLIWSAEHNAWWRANHNGYTHSLSEAGLCTEEEADDIMKNANIKLEDGPHYHTSQGWLYVHEVKIPVEMVRLSAAERAALIEAGRYYTKTWPNEEFIPSLESALQKI